MGVGLKKCDHDGNERRVAFLYTYESLLDSALVSRVHNWQNVTWILVSDCAVEAWAKDPSKWHHWKKTLD